MVDHGLFVADGRGIFRKAICHACGVDLLAVVHAEEIGIAARIGRKGRVLGERVGHWPYIWREVGWDERLGELRGKHWTWGVRVEEGIGLHGGIGAGEGDAYGAGLEGMCGEGEAVDACPLIVWIKERVHGISRPGQSGGPKESMTRWLVCAALDWEPAEGILSSARVRLSAPSSLAIGLLRRPMRPSP